MDQGIGHEEFSTHILNGSRVIRCRSPTHRCIEMIVGSKGEIGDGYKSLHFCSSDGDGFSQSHHRFCKIREGGVGYRGIRTDNHIRIGRTNHRTTETKSLKLLCTSNQVVVQIVIVCHLSVFSSGFAIELVKVGKGLFYRHPKRAAKFIPIHREIIGESRNGLSNNIVVRFAGSIVVDPSSHIHRDWPRCWRDYQRYPGDRCPGNIGRIDVGITYLKGNIDSLVHIRRIDQHGSFTAKGQNCQQE